MDKKKLDVEGVTQGGNLNIVLLVPVWGDEYTRLFVDYCLPSIQTPGNMGFIKSLVDSGQCSATLAICTQSDWWPLVAESPSITYSQNMIDVKFCCINSVFDEKKPYSTMSRAYELGMRMFESVEGTTWYFFLTPDSIWSENSFKYIWNQIRGGVTKAVMVPGLRVLREEAIKYIAAEARNPAAFEPRHLVSFAIKNMHPISKSLNWLAEEFDNKWPSTIYFTKSNNLMIGNSFHLHPAAIEAPDVLPPLDDTIDGAFMDRLGLEDGEYHLVRGSDDCLVLELSPFAGEKMRGLGKPSVIKLLIFALTATLPVHWMFFTQRYVWRGNGNVERETELNVPADRLVRLLSGFRWLAGILCWLRIHELRLKAGKLKRRLLG